MNGKIGLFGGTFDPIHNGHIQICESFLRSGYIDELWILPAVIPPQKENSVIATFEQRLAMLNMVFESHEHIRVLDIENSLPKPNYTIQTVRYFKKEQPNTDFMLCIGADSLKSMHTWHRYKELLQEIDLLVVSRPGMDTNKVEDIDPLKIRFVKHSDTTISSSEIRNALSKRRTTEDIPTEVLNYILQNDLYIR